MFASFKAQSMSRTCPLFLSLPYLRLRATTAKRRRPPKSRATGPLTLGGKSPIVGPRLKGEGLLAAACATGGSAVCKPKGEGYGNSDCHPHLVPTILLQPSSCRPGRRA
uniref:Uncharacterized protein n=1 Tax=Hyaloperonospora arabidopsidis (strain Emoy2) TaxID=559515 RepID=M4BCV6_HYAAE